MARTTQVLRLMSRQQRLSSRALEAMRLMFSFQRGPRSPRCREHEAGDLAVIACPARVAYCRVERGVVFCSPMSYPAGVLVKLCARGMALEVGDLSSFGQTSIYFVRDSCQL